MVLEPILIVLTLVTTSSPLSAPVKRPHKIVIQTPLSFYIVSSDFSSLVTQWPFWFGESDFQLSVVSLSLYSFNNNWNRSRPQYLITSVSGLTSPKLSLNFLYPFPLYRLRRKFLETTISFIPHFTNLIFYVYTSRNFLLYVLKK